jgi:4-amino-4-deoxy-L-arabinose transferase-like glycosyltransferase
MTPQGPVSAEGTAAPAGEGAWRLASRLLWLALAAIMLGTFLDYGLTGDEAVRQRYGRRLLRWYATLGADRDAVKDVDISRDGGLFEILAGLAAQVSPLDVYDTRHLVVVLFGLVAFFATHRLGKLLGGERAGFLALLILALTPPFYGHAFNNPKDVPFAALFALAAAAVIAASESAPQLRWSRVLAAGVAVGLVAGERVAGLVLIGYALLLWLAIALLRTRGTRKHLADVAPFAVRFVGFAALAWGVMLAFWPWAQTGPLVHPLRALQTFSRFWDCIVVYYDGRLVCSGGVSRFYLLRWMSLTLPGLYAVALTLTALGLAAAWRRRHRLTGPQRTSLLRAAWIALVAGVPVAFVTIMRTPLYDGLRHLLFVIPLLAVLCGVGVSAWLRTRTRRFETVAAVGVLALACLVTFVDMVRLHPYQALYFNRLVAGGPAAGIADYEGDYWCLTYKQGAEWLLKRYAGASCTDKIRVAGHSILQQTAYYFRKTEEGRQLFKPVTVKEDPHFVLSTTRFNDHLHTPGRIVHRIERQGATFFYLFELKTPDCKPAAAD